MNPKCDNEQKGLKPVSSGPGRLIGVRLKADQLAAVEDWAAKQQDIPNRPEAIRRLVNLGLSCQPRRED
jgi:hypothetical protein